MCGEGPPNLRSNVISCGWLGRIVGERAERGNKKNSVEEGTASIIGEEKLLKNVGLTNVRVETRAYVLG